MTERKNKSYYLSITVALIFLLNPNFNMIDILPDFVGYFLLARAIGGLSELLPYFYETKSALTNLGFVTLARIPAMAVMYANMYTGRDIVPLFTLVFSVIEVALLIKAVINGSMALYYLGERSEAKSLISPLKFFRRSVKAESVKNMTLFFVIAKAALNTIPQFCLLSNSDGSQISKYLFPILEMSGMLICLILGIVWFVFVRKYLSVIKKEGQIAEGIRAIAGEEKLENLEMQKQAKSMNYTLIFFATASLFSFDIAFEQTNNVNILPHFIYGIMLLIVGWRLLSSKYKRPLLLSSAAYIVTGVIGQVFTGKFFSQFSYVDLADSKAAKSAYLPVEVCGALEFIFFLALAAVMAFGFRDFIKAHTGISPDSERYGITTARMHKKLCIKAYALFTVSALVQLSKCLNTFFHGNVTTYFTETAEIQTEPMLPWFGVVVFALTVIYVGYSFYYLWEIRDEVKTKYSETEKA